MISKIENMASTEIPSSISQLRNSGQLAEAIALCQEAAAKYPDSYFYPKVAGDIYFQKEDFDNASQSYIEFLKRLPPNIKLFGDFARRYYRLRRVLPPDKMREYSATIMSYIKEGYLPYQNAVRCTNLVKYDLLSKEIAISDQGQIFANLLSDDSHFQELANQAKVLEAKSSVELEYLLDKYVLNRARTSKTKSIDTYCISLYEKMGKYSNALKLAEELLSLPLDPVVIRAIFRICRKMENYERAAKLLSRHPEILKHDSFNVLYELVYYFEFHDNMEQVQAMLNKIERGFAQSIPIQRTVKNFYLRFGLLEDANRLENNIANLYEMSKEKPRYLIEVQESEAEIGSRIKELSSELEHTARLAAISDLTTGISHELGQPITNIRYTLQFYRKLLEKRPSQQVVFHVFDSILEETNRMGALINRLSPITSSRSIVETFDIVERTQRRIKAESMRIQRAGIQVQISPKRPLYLYGDPVKFDQIISNLLINSIDGIRARNKPGINRIRINFLEKEDVFRIAFADTGIGIHAKFRGKIFEPFFTTKAPGKGEGLGLFIVWNLLKMQGGKIILDPTYTQGARFLIDIPKNTEHEREA